MKKNIDKENFLEFEKAKIRTMNKRFITITKTEFYIQKLKYEDKKLNHSFSSYV